MKSPTNKQLQFIHMIEEHKIYGIKPFDGETCQEASDWLSKYVPVFKEYQAELTQMNKLDFYTNRENESRNG